MKTKTLLIEIHLGNITKSDLDLRHILVDTIENRGLGQVVEETSSPTMIEVILEVSGSTYIGAKLQGLLASLGFNNYSIQDISIGNEE